VAGIKLKAANAIRDWNILRPKVLADLERQVLSVEIYLQNKVFALGSNPILRFANENRRRNLLTMVDPPCSSHEFLDKINTAQRASQHTHTVFPKQFNTKFNKSHFDEHIDASRQRNKRRLTSYNTLCLVIMLAKDAPLRQSVGLHKSPHLQNPIVSSTDQPSHTVSI